MAQIESVPRRGQARLVVPDLVDRPFVGAGCCALPANELVCESVGQVRGVYSVACDDVLGVVGVEFDETSTALATAVAVLDGLGYAVAAVEA